MDVAFAIADPVRRGILDGLRAGVASAGEIAARFEITRPAVSRHRRVLRECGLVVDEVRGRQRFDRLDLAPLEPLEAWLAGLRAGAADTADRWDRAFDALETEVHRTRRERRTTLPRTTTPRADERSA